MRYYVHVFNGTDDPETWEPVESFESLEAAEAFRASLSVPSYVETVVLDA